MRREGRTEGQPQSRYMKPGFALVHLTFLEVAADSGLEILENQQDGRMVKNETMESLHAWMSLEVEGAPNLLA